MVKSNFAKIIGESFHYLLTVDLNELEKTIRVPNEHDSTCTRNVLQIVPTGDGHGAEWGYASDTAVCKACRAEYLENSRRQTLETAKDLQEKWGRGLK
ncbi:MAG: hypothetical protein ACYCOU_03700 [Sulfobacillus sp.]